MFKVPRLLLLCLALSFTTFTSKGQQPPAFLGHFKDMAMASCDNIRMDSPQKIPLGGMVTSMVPLDTTVIPFNKVIEPGSSHAVSLLHELQGIRIGLAQKTGKHLPDFRIVGEHYSTETATLTVGDKPYDIEQHITYSTYSGNGEERFQCYDPIRPNGNETLLDSTLVFSGDSNSLFIVNVYGDLRITGNAEIILDGINSDQVIWNIWGGVHDEVSAMQGVVFAKGFRDNSNSRNIVQRLSIFAMEGIQINHVNEYLYLNSPSNHRGTPPPVLAPQLAHRVNFGLFSGINNSTFYLGALDLGISTYDLTRLDLGEIGGTNTLFPKSLSHSTYDDRIGGVLGSLSDLRFSMVIGEDKRVFMFGLYSNPEFYGLKFDGYDPNTQAPVIGNYSIILRGSANPHGDVYPSDLVPNYEFSQSNAVQVLAGYYSAFVLVEPGELWMHSVQEPTISPRLRKSLLVDLYTNSISVNAKPNLVDLSNTTHDYLYKKIDRTLTSNGECDPTGIVANNVSSIGLVSKVALTFNQSLAILDVNGNVFVAGRIASGEAGVRIFQNTNQGRVLRQIEYSDVPIKSFNINGVQRVFDIAPYGDGFATAVEYADGSHGLVTWGNSTSSNTFNIRRTTLPNNRKIRKIKGFDNVLFVFAEDGTVYGLKTPYVVATLPDLPNQSPIPESIAYYGAPNINVTARLTELPHLYNFTDISNMPYLHTFFGTRCDGKLFAWGFCFKNIGFQMLASGVRDHVYLGMEETEFNTNQSLINPITPAERFVRSNEVYSEFCAQANSGCLRGSITASTPFQGPGVTYQWSLVSPIPAGARITSLTNQRNVTVETNSPGLHRLRLTTKVSGTNEQSVIRSFESIGSVVTFAQDVNVCRGASFTVFGTANSSNVDPGLVTWNIVGATPSQNSASPTSGKGLRIYGTVTQNSVPGYIEYEVSIPQNNGTVCTGRVRVLVVAPDAGPDLTVCRLTTTTLNLTGTNPTGGTWSGQYVNGNTFDVASAPVGEYTLTYTGAVQGANCSDTRVITVTEDCITCYELPAQILGAPGTVTNITTNTTLSGKIVVRGGLRVLDGVTLTLASQCTLVFAPGNVTTQPLHESGELCKLKNQPGEYSYLYLSSGARLEATNATLRAVQSSNCGVEWQGIIAENNTQINLLGAAAEDIVIANAAEYGIRLVECGGINQGSAANLTMRYTTMTESYAGLPLTVNPGSVKVYKFPNSNVTVDIQRSRFVWGDGLVLPAPSHSGTVLRNNYFDHSGTALKIIQGVPSLPEDVYQVIANTFHNPREKAVEVGANDVNMNLRCNLFESGPSATTIYGVYITTSGVLNSLGGATSTDPFSPMGNGWPVERTGPNFGNPIPGWVSFYNANPTFQARYFRAENEDIGDEFPTSYSGYLVTKVNGVKYYSGPTSLQPSGTIRVCDDSPLYGGGYFRVGVVTSLEEEIDQIQIYPNPSSGEVRISGGEVKDLALIAPDGRTLPLLGTQEESTYRLDMSGLNPGLYIIKATVGGRSIYEKVVKL